MDKKKITKIPAAFQFENILGVKERKIKVAVFMPNMSKALNTYSAQTMLKRINFFELVGIFTNEKGYQRGKHRFRKIFDLYNETEIDLLICNNKIDLDIYEEFTENTVKLKINIPIYVVRDCILIKDNKVIYLN